MIHGTKIALAALVTGLLTTLPLQSQAEEGAATVETPPWYEFEVIIFERIAKGAGSTEAWPTNPETPSLLDAIPFDTRGTETLKDNAPIPYRPLPAGEQRLGEIWTRFRNSRNYRPLYHVAWRQQVVDPELAQKLYVYLPPEDGETVGPTNPPLLEGTLKIGVKRYLHVEADLLLRRPAETSAAPSTDGGFISGPSTTAYRLHELSRMRSGKLLYLDHPVLGVLVQAEKFKLPEPEPVPEPEMQPASGEPQPINPAGAQPTSPTDDSGTQPQPTPQR